MGGGQFVRFEVEAAIDARHGNGCSVRQVQDIWGHCEPSDQPVDLAGAARSFE